MGYQGMSIEDVKPRQDSWQDKIDAERMAFKAHGANVEELSLWQMRLQTRVVADWWELADRLITKWNDYERSGETTIGAASGYPADFARMIGMNNDIHPRWVQPAIEPYTVVPEYVAPTVSLPRVWDPVSRQWTDFLTLPVSASHLSARHFHFEVGIVHVVVFGAVMLLGGLFMGYAVGLRQRLEQNDAYAQLLH